MPSSFRKPEPPYDFVPLPEAKLPFPSPEILSHATWQIAKPDVYTGRLTLKATVARPVHIGSGLYELSEEVGFAKGVVVRGIVRVGGEPVIPGSSWKGAVRATYEACTKSCLRLVTQPMQEQYSTEWRRSKIPAPTVDELVGTHRLPAHGRVSVRLARDVLRKWESCREVRNSGDLKLLCPACALFGGLGYRGRVRFLEGYVTKSTIAGERRAIKVDSANSPHLHRAGTPKVTREGQRPSIEISDLQGRKFYRYGGRNQRPREPIDYLPEGVVLALAVEFERLLRAEIGGILLCVGLGDGPRLRVGGGKPFGLGELQVELSEVELRSTDAWGQYEVQPTTVSDRDAWVRETTDAFKSAPIFHSPGFDRLRALWREAQGTQR